MKIAVIFGTRPEAIKLAPVVLGLRESRRVDCRVCVTAQHREMLDQVLKVFEIVPDRDLDLMTTNQNLVGITARALEGVDAFLKCQRPDLVIVQGDTTTTLAAAVASFYNSIPVAHVEAGLRTGNLRSPWPEEANRVLTSHLAAVHFAPTETNRQNLMREGIPPDRIHVTGNTVIDALLLARRKARSLGADLGGLCPALDKRRAEPSRVVLITGHRRESFGDGVVAICRAIALLAQRFPDVDFVYPVHLNPNVYGVVTQMLGSSHGGGKLPNVHLIEPLAYLPFVALMDRSTLVLTDSGGIQEEAPSLGKPVLVMRDTTERPEAVEAGAARLVGTKTDDIVREVSLLLTDDEAYAAMARAINPYGDGHAAQRIVDIVQSGWGATTI